MYQFQMSKVTELQFKKNKNRNFQTFPLLLIRKNNNLSHKEETILL